MSLIWPSKRTGQIIFKKNLYHLVKAVDPNQLASDEANWSESTFLSSTQFHINNETTPDWLEIRIWYSINGPQREKTCLRGFANNTGADQPAHLTVWSEPLLFAYWKVSYLNLLQANSLFLLVSVAEEAGLNLTLWKPRRQIFSQWGPNDPSSTLCALSRACLLIGLNMVVVCGHFQAGCDK